MKTIVTSINPTKIILRYLSFCQEINPKCVIISTFNTKCQTYQATIFGNDQVSMLQFCNRSKRIYFNKPLVVPHDKYRYKITKDVRHAMKMSDAYFTISGYVTHEKAIVYVQPDECR